MLADLMLANNLGNTRVYQYASCDVVCPPCSVGACGCDGTPDTLYLTFPNDPTNYGACANAVTTLTRSPGFCNWTGVCTVCTHDYVITLTCGVGHYFLSINNLNTGFDDVVNSCGPVNVTFTPHSCGLGTGGSTTCQGLNVQTPCGAFTLTQ